MVTANLGRTIPAFIDVEHLVKESWLLFVIRSFSFCRLNAYTNLHRAISVHRHSHFTTRYIIASSSPSPYLSVAVTFHNYIHDIHHPVDLAPQHSYFHTRP